MQSQETKKLKLNAENRWVSVVLAGQWFDFRPRAKVIAEVCAVFFDPGIPVLKGKASPPAIKYFLKNCTGRAMMLV